MRLKASDHPKLFLCINEGKGEITDPSPEQLGRVKELIRRKKEDGILESRYEQLQGWILWDVRGRSI